MLSPIKKISLLGCGWLGLPLAEELIRSGYQVLGSTTSPEKIPLLRKAGIVPYLIKVGNELEGEVKDFFQTDLLLLNIPPGRRREDVEARYPAAIRLVVEQALQAGTKRLIFISSTSVYANSNAVVREAEKALASSGSGLALVRCENYLQRLPGLPLTILRLAGLVGGDRKAGRFLAGKKDIANGDAPVNMVHREDCIAIIKKIVEGGIFGEIFNVCTDKHPSRKDFYRQQALKDGFEAPTFLEGGSLNYKIIANDKLKQRLNYTFLHPDPMTF